MSEESKPIAPGGAPQVTTVHDLKCLTAFFDRILSGEKPFEMRKDDRGYKAGHFLRLRDWSGEEYTGREVTVEVTYLLAGLGLEKDYVVMGFTPHALRLRLVAAEKEIEAAHAAARGVTRLRADLASARASLTTAEKEIRGVLDSMGSAALTVRENGGPENIYASLAVSVAHMKRKLAAGDAPTAPPASDSSALEKAEKALEEWRIGFCVATGSTGANEMKPADQHAVVAELMQRAARAAESRTGAASSVEPILR